MTARNLAWYNLNETRPYPIDDSANLVDHLGNMLPHNLIVDAQLRFPFSVAKYAFLGQITVREKVVSLSFFGCRLPAHSTLCDEDPVEFEEPPLLATLSVPQPAPIYRPLPLTSHRRGVLGWVVLGGGIQEKEYEGRFSGSSQSLLVPFAARFYYPSPYFRSRVAGSTVSTSGVIPLVGNRDVDIRLACIEVPIDVDPSLRCNPSLTRVRRVIRIALADRVNEEGRTLLDVYRGPGEGRPESRSCGDPQPIESIHGVIPDCCGRITLELRGNIRILPVVGQAPLSGSPIQPASSVLLGSSTGLENLCAEREQRRLPDALGRLPSEIEAECISSSLVLDPEPDAPWIPPEQDNSVGPFDPATYSTDFETTQPMQMVMGWWEWRVPEEEPTQKCLTCESPQGAIGWNMALWMHTTQDFTIHTAKKRFHAQVRMRIGKGGGWQYNAGIVLNYKWDPILERPTFFLVEADWSSQMSGQPALRIARYNGWTMKTIKAAPFPKLRLGVRYWIGAAVYATVGYDQGDDTAWVHAEMRAVDEDESGQKPSVQLVQAVRHYGSFVGRVGVLSQRSALRILSWYVNDASAPPPTN